MEGTIEYIINESTFKRINRLVKRVLNNIQGYIGDNTCDTGIQGVANNHQVGKYG